MTDFQRAKYSLDNFKFPIISLNNGYRLGDFHYSGKDKHDLLSTEDIQKIEGFEAIIRQNYCEECQEIRNQSITLVNGKENKVYTKYYMKHSKLC